MRSLSLTFALALALSLPLSLVTSCATPTDAPDKMSTPRARDFMPLAVGNKWEYRIKGAPPEAPIDAREIVEKDSQGFFVANNGQRLAPRTDGIFDGERFLLQEPIETGHEWIAVPKDMPDGVERYKITAVGTSARVPAGTFDGCVEVEFSTVIRHKVTNEKATITVTSTYAPGVGLIKTTGNVVPEKSQGETMPALELVKYDVKPAG
jgi:hypothetical protein